MTVHERIEKVLAGLPETRLWEVYDFARYLRWLEHEAKEEFNAWHRPSPSQVEQLYGPEDDVYLPAELPPKGQP